MEASSTSQVDFVQLYARIEIINMVFLGSYVMLIYDHALTLGEEVRKIWRAPLSIPKILFLLNRYLTPIFYALSFVEYTAISDTTYVQSLTNIVNRGICRRMYKDVISFALITTAICECLMIIRVYALTGRNRIIAGGLAAIWLIQVVLWIITIPSSPLQMLPSSINGCSPSNTPLQIVFWIFPMVIDSLVFLITLGRTKAAGPRSEGPVSSSIERFRRDGILYFFCIFTVNTINLLFSTASQGRLNGTAAALATLLTSTMVSRLVLNLRNEPSEDQTVVSTIIGNMGSFVDDGEPNEEDEIELTVKDLSDVFERRTALYNLYYRRR